METLSTGRLSLALVGALVVAAGFWLSGSVPVAALGCSLVFLSFVSGFLAPDRPFPIRWLILLVAGLQWVLAPALLYLQGNPPGIYYMRVDQGSYFGAVVPAYFALAAGILSIGVRSERDFQSMSVDLAGPLLAKRPLLPAWLVALSLVGTLGGVLLPGPFSFVWYMTASLKFSAVLLLVYGEHKRWKLWTAGVLLVAFIESAASSLFHDAVLWAAVVAVAMLHKHRVKAGTRLLIVAIAGCLLLVNQSAKGEYRSMVAEGRTAASAGSYFSMASRRAGELLGGTQDILASYNALLTRLNQGWIISAIIRHMETTPIAGGETIRQGVEAAFVPRFLAPNKPTAAGQETFIRFTGLPIGRDTSMGASIVGEGYGNFGREMNWLFMLSYGVTVASILALLQKRSGPIMLALLPAGLLHVIKAESDFVTSANFLVKGAVFVSVLSFAFARLVPVRRISLPKR